MIAVISSKNNVPIRLTDERWRHIVKEHAEMSDFQGQLLEAIAQPEKIYAGNTDEFLATNELEPDKWLIVVYREMNDDGFVITAFLTRRLTYFQRRRQLWP